MNAFLDGFQATQSRIYNELKSTLDGDWLSKICAVCDCLQDSVILVNPLENAYVFERMKKVLVYPHFVPPKLLAFYDFILMLICFP